ncbi:MAG: hypothetical protein JW709_03460 [Sedimentisphaerales bacterium]|nr:hypothetical protein [Sedimentisphaerales bacterium]
MKKVIQRGFLCLLFCFVSTIEASDASDYVNDMDLLISKMRESEIGLLNINGESEVWTESKTTAKGEWQKGKDEISFSTKFWINGLPKSKIRVDVKGQKFLWHKNDKEIIVEKDYSLSYNGKYGMTFELKKAIDGEISYPKRGSILPYAPKALYSENILIATGQRFSMNYFFVNHDEFDSFSDLLSLNVEAIREGKPAYEVSSELFQGLECIKISTPSTETRVSEIFWLDPNRCLSLVGYENTNTKKDGFEWLISKIIVTKIEEVAPGIWYPTEATIVAGPSSPGGVFRRTIYRATNVQANMPDYDEKKYVIKFPIDSQVENLIENK